LIRKGRERLVDHIEDARPRFGLRRFFARAGSMPAAACARKRRSVPARVAFSVCGFAISLACLAAIGGGLLMFRLAHGPLFIDALGPRIAQALDERLGPGYRFSLGETAITTRSYGPALAVDGFTLRGPGDRTILSAPRAEVSVDPIALITGRVVPKRLEVFDVELHLLLLPDGTLALSTGSDAGGLVTLAGPLAAALAAEPPATGASESSPASPVPDVGLPRALVMKRIGTTVRFLIDSLTNPQSAIAAIDRVGISRGRLVIEDRTTNQTATYQGLQLAYDKTTGLASLTLNAEGPNGPLSVVAKANGLPGEQRRLDIEWKDVSRDEIGLISGMRDFGADFDMPLSGEMGIGLTPANLISQATGALHLGSGFLRLDDPDAEPIMFDHIDGDFRWNGAERRIVLDALRMAAGTTRFTFGGTIAPPVREGDAWNIEIATNEPGIYGAELPGEDPIQISHLGLAARLLADQKHLTLDRFELKGPDCGLALSADIDWKDGAHVKLVAAMDPTPAPIVARLWPSFIVGPVRNWFLHHIRGGMIENGALKIDLDAAALKMLRNDRPPPDEDVRMDFTVSNGSVDFLQDVPPLRHIEGIGHITGRTSTFTAKGGLVDLGNGHRLTLSDGVFLMPDGDIKPTPATLNARVTGTVEAVNDLLSRDALRPYANVPINMSTAKGQADGRLSLDLKLGNGAEAADTQVTINANVTNFSAEKLLGPEKLEAAALQFTYDATGLRATGQGRLFGVPATLDIVKPVGKQGEATINLTIDDAARSKQGFAAVPGMTGPIAAHIVAPLGVSDKQRAQVELDLTKTAIETSLPGLSKPAGRAGKATFALVTGESSTLIDQLAVDSAPFQARGSLELGADGGLISARFSQIKFSPGDDMKIEAAKSAEGVKIVVRASTIDARPFLKPFGIAGEPTPMKQVAPPPGHKEGQPSKDFEIDLKSGIVTGFNRQVASGVELRLAKHGDQIRQFALEAHFGRDAVSGAMQPGVESVINVATGDAGSLLSFIDLYRHMEGGQLSAIMRPGDEESGGFLEIKNFVLRDEPALRKLVAEGVPQHANNDDARALGKIDPGAVSFNRLQVHFQRSGARLDLRDGFMFGPNIGLSVDGAIDFAHNHVNLSGTFVPAYAVNNLFSKIPLFGVFLGGGSNEGLFAVNYRINGAPGAPTLTVNPLSAIAPGFLRKIVGVGDLVRPGETAPAPPGASSDPAGALAR